MKSMIIVHPTDPVDRLALGAEISRNQPNSLVLVQCYDCEGDGHWVLAFGQLELIGFLRHLCAQSKPSTLNPALNSDSNFPLYLNGTVEEIHGLLERALVSA